MVSGYTGANDHKGLARPTNRNRRSFGKFKNFLGKGGRIHLGTTVMVFFFRHARHAVSYKT